MSSFTIVLRGCGEDVVAAQVAEFVPQARVKRIYQNKHGQTTALLVTPTDTVGAVRGELNFWMWACETVAHTIGDSLRPGDLVWWTGR